MKFLLQLISNYGVTTIIVIGVITFGGLFLNGQALSTQKGRIKDVLERKNKKYNVNSNSKEIEETDDESVSITPDTIRKYETEFNKKCSIHGVLVQIIPIFPLLGILGTVAGLILQIQAMNSGGDPEGTGMLGSLDVALYTTLVGLIFAIALKFFDALFPSRIIYDVEVMMDDFDKKINIAEMFENFKDK